ncbi:NusG domain II-containing protein [Eubacteriales bacterium OttesenSCG-928-K08]|nr:NusG domain II-containing protein [Eubacteriales bacterium OttesenSCG-928-K08]
MRLITTALVLLALFLAVLCGCQQKSSGEKTEKQESCVVIYINSKEYTRVALGEDQVVEIDQSNGKINKVTITADGAFMSYSTCENQNCVLQGSVTLDNYAQRALGEWIICLPNQVTVELIEGEAE